MKSDTVGWRPCPAEPRSVKPPPFANRFVTASFCGTYRSDDASLPDLLLAEFPSPTAVNVSENFPTTVQLISNYH